MARGTASACGVAGGVLPDKPRLLWTFTAENQGFEAGAAIDRGRVYVGSTTGTVYCIDLASGKKLWEKAGKSIYKTTPAVRDGHVYLGDQDGDFNCFDTQSGQFLWKYGTDGPIDSPAVFYRDHVLFGSEDGGEYCLNEAGKLVWKTDLEDQVRCLATIAGNRGYFATCGAMLYTLDLDKGTSLGKTPIESPTGCAAALGAIEFSWATRKASSFPSIWSRERSPGAIHDPERAMSYRSSAAVTADGVYVGSRNKLLYAFEPGGGRILWQFPTRGMIDSSPVVVGDRLFFGSQDGRVYGLDRRSGKEVWRYDAGGKIYASPAVAAGRLVIGSGAGKVYCFGR